MKCLLQALGLAWDRSIGEAVKYYNANPFYNCEISVFGGIPFKRGYYVSYWVLTHFSEYCIVRKPRTVNNKVFAFFFDSP